MKKGRRSGMRSLAALTAWAIAAVGPAGAAPDREVEWSVAAWCFESVAGGRAVVWGLAAAIGPAVSTGIVCRAGDAPACSAEMPGPLAVCHETRPSDASVAVAGSTCGQAWAVFTNGTTAETHTC